MPGAVEKSAEAHTVLPGERSQITPQKQMSHPDVLTSH